uniref:Uncharacterized protein n=1 Tax=Panagrellus redivivus TaxID=6233 RepID=A0A7E4UQZ8_PANRE
MADILILDDSTAPRHDSSPPPSRFRVLVTASTSPLLVPRPHTTRGRDAGISIVSHPNKNYIILRSESRPCGMVHYD